MIMKPPRTMVWNESFQTTWNDNAPIRIDPFYLALQASHHAAGQSAITGLPEANDLASSAIDAADMGRHRAAAETHRAAADAHDQEISRLMSASTYAGQGAEGPMQAHTDAAHAHRQAATRHEEAAAKDRGSKNREQPTMTDNQFGPLPEIPVLNWSDMSKLRHGLSTPTGPPPGRFGVGDPEDDPDDDLDDIDDLEPEPVPVPQNLAEVVLNHQRGGPVALPRRQQPRRQPAAEEYGPMPDIPNLLDLVANDRRQALAAQQQQRAQRQQQTSEGGPSGDVEGLGPMPDPPTLNWEQIAAQHRRRDSQRRS
jgi:hypothetical protein